MKKKYFVGAFVSAGVLAGLFAHARFIRPPLPRLSECYIELRDSDKVARHITDQDSVGQLARELYNRFPSASSPGSVAVVYFRVDDGFYYVRVPLQKTRQSAGQGSAGESDYPELDKIIREDGWSTSDEPDLRATRPLAWTNTGAPKSNADIFFDGTYWPSLGQWFLRKLTGSS